MKIKKIVMIKKYKKFNENIDWEFDEDETNEILPEFVGHEVFYNFLVKHNILDEYINSYYGSRFLKWSIKELLDHKKFNYFDSYIDSFNWSNTKEGHNFWSNINKKWKQWLKFKN